MEPDPRLPLAVDGEPGEEAAETLGVARGGTFNVLGAGFNAVIRVTVTLLLGQMLGSGAVGFFYQAFAVHDVLALVATAGFQTAMTRFVAVHRADDDRGRLRGVVHLGLLIPTGIGAGFGLALALSAGSLASAFGDPEMESLLRIIAIALPFTAFTDSAIAATQGFKTMRYHVGISLGFEPLFRLLVTVGVLASGGGVRGAVTALVITNVLAAGLAAAALRKLMGPPTVSPRYEVREVLTFSLLTWGTSLAIDAFIWGDTILLGLFRSAEEVGVYQVATRIVILAAIFVQPVGLAFAPRITDLYRKGKLEILGSTYRTVTGWIMRLVIPMSVILFLVPDRLLVLFGDGFTDGVNVTRILAVGALLHGSTGPSMQMLMMMGHPAKAFRNNVATVAVNIGLNLWLIPAYGVEGAAVAWLISIAFSNAIVVVQIYDVLHRTPFSFVYIKALSAGTVALGAGIAAGRVVGLAGDVLQVLTAIIVYAIVSRWMGFSDEDLQIARAFRSRLKVGSRSDPSSE